MGCCCSKTTVSKKFQSTVSVTNATSVSAGQKDATKPNQNSSRLSLRPTKSQSEASIVTSSGLGRNEAAYLTATPPKDLKKWSVEDTFWGKKKKLMPNKKTLAMLDRHAVEVSVFC